MDLATATLLFLAAVFGGALNAVAGGGTFVAFPVLLFTGVPPVPANATNTVALWTGLAFSGGAFRHHLNVRRPILIALVSVSALGGIAGAILLLRTPARTFMRLVPWLMLSATLLFLLGRRLLPAKTAPVNRNASARAIVLASCFQLLVAIYGGYFGGGMSIVILAMLALFGMADIYEMNALKAVLSSATNGVAVLIFIFSGAVYWRQGLIMIAGAALGGYFGARYSLRLSPGAVRWFVIAVGFAMTTYFFLRIYFERS